MESKISPKGNIGIKKCGGIYIDIIVSMCYNTSKRKENTMKTGYIYWNTICDYFYKDEFNLSNDVVNDAKTINHIKYLWRCASKEYLKNQDIDDMVEMQIDIDSLRQETYQGCYDEFRSYLMCLSDRIGINRWLYLQLLINKAYDLVYDRYCKEYDWRNWTDEIQGGFTDKSLVHGYDLIYQKEWIGTILPLIKQAQRNED